MAFVRTKRVGKSVYLYKVTSYRDAEGRPRQKHERYLGKAPKLEDLEDKDGASSEQQLEDSCNG